VRFSLLDVRISTILRPTTHKPTRTGILRIRTLIWKPRPRHRPATQSLRRRRADFNWRL